MSTKSIIVISILLLADATVAKAKDVTAGLQLCKAINGAAKRLACFDQLTSATQSKKRTQATSDSSSGCKIEDWSFSEKASSIYINGTATCSTGKLIYRLYDGNTNKFITSGFTYIEGYAFQSYADGSTPGSLNIKYTIN